MRSLTIVLVRRRIFQTIENSFKNLAFITDDHLIILTREAKKEKRNEAIRKQHELPDQAPRNTRSDTSIFSLNGESSNNDWSGQWKSVVIYGKTEFVRSAPMITSSEISSLSCHQEEKKRMGVKFFGQIKISSKKTFSK